MSSTIDEYREAKDNYLKLRNQAKKELLGRFNDLAAELLDLQQELLEDFGEKVVIPTKPKRPRSPKTAKSDGKAPAPTPAIRRVELEKQIERTKKKLAETRAAGKPTKATEDRIYELEDELRLLPA
jgi:hypothetical protein